MRGSEDPLAAPGILSPSIIDDGGASTNALPGSCGSHVIVHDGGAENGGVTMYQSNCGPEWTAFYAFGGQIQVAHGTLFFGQATGESFCVQYPYAQSCDVGFDWCEIDPCCLEDHPYHVYSPVEPQCEP